MANSITKTRTNYVRVTDPEGFKAAVQACVVDNGEEIEIGEKPDENGIMTYSFACADNMCGIRIPDENDECDGNCAECGDSYECDIDCSWDAFLESLQPFIAEGDALIVTTLSRLKLAELHAYAEIVTNKEIKGLTLETLALDLAREMLGDEKWNTQNYG